MSRGERMAIKRREDSEDKSKCRLVISDDVGEVLGVKVGEELVRLPITLIALLVDRFVVHALLFEKGHNFYTE